MELPYDIYILLVHNNKYAFFNNQVTYEEYLRVQFWLENLLDSGYFKGKVT